MRLGIKGKQVLGVGSIAMIIVVALSVAHLGHLARISLDESKARAELLSNAIFQRAREVVVDTPDPHQALRSDPGLRSILEASLYSKDVTFAAIADVGGNAIAHADRSLEDQPLPAADDLDALVNESSYNQLFAIYSGQDSTLQHRQPLLLGNQEFGSIRIGVATPLIRKELGRSVRSALLTAAIGLGAAVFGAMLLAQLLLRPIHVIRSGLTRLGRGEFGVRLDLNQADEFGELGTFFNAVSAQLSADRSQMAGQVANLESAVQYLEDAVAIVSPSGELLFANSAMGALLPGAQAGSALAQLVAADHPLRRLAADTMASRQSRGPVSAAFPIAGEQGDRLILTHPVNDVSGNLVGVMLIVRNLEYLSRVESTVRYSRKLVALGRLSAGVAHEVKNPLNAMMIHLELLRQQVVSPVAVAAGGGGGGVATIGAPPAPPQALAHVDVIASEIRRLDQVVQGFLKFTRPEDLTLQPVSLLRLFEEITPIVRPEASRTGVEVAIDVDAAPLVNGDPGMLRQAFLNLALNACQAMPQGGTLRIWCETVRGGRVAVNVSDSGVGIKPEDLKRIFDLYFTTKEKGSGIGLSMVYRTVQMHDGEIEVQSTPGVGTTFRVLLPQA
jgi:signal transduction histidine kinase